MSLSVNWLLNFMWIDNLIFIDHFWNHLCHLFPFLSPLLSTFRSGSVNAKSKRCLLVSMSKGVGILFEISNMTSVSDPCWLRNFVVEESGAVALTPLFHSEPVDNIRFKSLTSKLGGCPLSIQVCHGIIPCLSRVQVYFPAISLLSCSPVRNFESLEESSRSSIETDISDSFLKSVWMEVLSINVELDVWLLEELVIIHVFYSKTYIILN
jgi:hypothetical protein